MSPREQRAIEGLTNAASIWVTAAVGVAAGLGRLGAAILSVALAWITLSLLLKIGNPAAHRAVANTQNDSKNGSK